MNLLAQAVAIFHGYNRPFRCQHCGEPLEVAAYYWVNDPGTSPNLSLRYRFCACLLKSLDVKVSLSL